MMCTQIFSIQDIKYFALQSVPESLNILLTRISNLDQLGFFNLMKILMGIIIYRISSYF